MLYVRVFAELAQVIIRAFVKVNLEVPQQDFVVFPFINGGQIVAAHDEGKLLVGVFFPQKGQSVNGVGGLWQAEFNVGGPEQFVVANGQLHEVKAVVVTGQRGFGLERVLRTHDQPHLIKVGLRCHEIGNDHVPHVYGIERTEEQAYFQGQ